MYIGDKTQKSARGHLKTRQISTKTKANTQEVTEPTDSRNAPTTLPDFVDETSPSPYEK